jgi:MoCo/4Fe-4S cofactor protein with predicted Tat translocation signal
MSSLKPTGAEIPQGRAYWRSLEELAETPEFRAVVEREFPSQASELKNVHSRRAFMKVMGASLSLAGMTGCRWPKENILPFAHRPEDRIPGIPVQYATAMEIGGGVQGLLVTSYDGRPIKVEGNPGHPINLGAADMLAQASILEMYDPDRSQAIIRLEGGQRFDAGWDDFLAFAGTHFGDLGSRGGEGLRVLSEESWSPALSMQRRRFLEAFPRARWIDWEPLSREAERAGARLVFGRPLRAQLDLSRAEVIVSLDSDFLADHPAALRNARGFAAGRRAENGRMSRLYAVEPSFTVTGAMADHRYAVPAAAAQIVAGRLAAEVFAALGSDVPATLAPFAGALMRFREHPYQAPFVTQLARDLVQHRGRALVLVGPRQPAEAQALGHLLNLALGAGGGERVVSYTEEMDGPQGEGSPAGVLSGTRNLLGLCREMQAGEVRTLVILGGNPVFNAPADLEFMRALEQVPSRIHLGLYRDETAEACLSGPGGDGDRGNGGVAGAIAWHIPRAHALESWGDLRAWDGTYSVVQPLIAPLYDGKTSIELVATLAGRPAAKGYDLVRESLQSLRGPQLPGDFEALWRTVLANGILGQSAAAPIDPEIRGADLAQALGAYNPAAPALGRDNLEIVFARDPSIYDGRFANNGWLQEAPDPLTRITWDNAALVSPSTAAALGLKMDQVVTLRYRGREVNAPVYVMPGQAPFSVTLALGYGRHTAGRVGTGVGADAYRLRTSEASGFDSGLALAATRRTRNLATTQDHHIIDRVGLREMGHRVAALVREGTLEEYRKDPEFARHEVEHPPLVSLWKEHEYKGHRWGMAIDLNSCIGCGACVVACTAENNIPVVGRERVLEGREMHWLRVDRYFVGDPETPEVAHQPVACVHCENAPCEQVCPVAATMHDSEGLNVMVYNRCIGTRYCSNNCPYKVRRFNFFNYRKGLSLQEKMAYNPEVTVRSRGVMEKCTYCIQRIESVKIAAKNDKRPITDGEITPACAQTCPTQAIVFGDLSDPGSRVAKLHADPRSYGMLAELNTKPRTEYLARLRNPAPEGEL